MTPRHLRRRRHDDDNREEAPVGIIAKLFRGMDRNTMIMLIALVGGGGYLKIDGVVKEQETRDVDSAVFDWMAQANARLDSCSLARPVERKQDRRIRVLEGKVFGGKKPPTLAQMYGPPERPRPKKDEHSWVWRMIHGRDG